MTITNSTLIAWLRRAAMHIHEQRGYLTELDAAIGDADHGANLDRGFAAVLDLLDGIADHDAGAILKAAGMRLIATVGGASGPLYGTAFRRMGKALEGHFEIEPADILLGLEAFRDGIVAMGKAAPGDKTIVDALQPALRRLAEQLAAGGDLPGSLALAAAAADAGALATVPLVARRGRASYLGERSSGHQDPGATSAALIIRALAEAVSEAG